LKVAGKIISKVDIESLFTSIRVSQNSITG
jgi:hypothetical protein